MGTSRSLLAQRFAERIGEPTIQYLTRWRLQMAANLLEDRLTTIATVADRVGYGSAPAFSRAVKRVLGVTPTEWRGGGVLIGRVGQRKECTLWTRALDLETAADAWRADEACGIATR